MFILFQRALARREYQIAMSGICTLGTDSVSYNDKTDAKYSSENYM